MGLFFLHDVGSEEFTLTAQTNNLLLLVLVYCSMSELKRKERGKNKKEKNERPKEQRETGRDRSVSAVGVCQSQ